MPFKEGARQNSRPPYQRRVRRFSGTGGKSIQPQQEIHILLDNLSAHKTQKVAAFLEEHPQVKLHFAPTYSSWLNHVEIWFARIEREVIARGIFTSVKDLARNLMHYIRTYSKNAQPFKWKYSDVKRESSHVKELSATAH